MKKRTKTDTSKSNRRAVADEIAEPLHAEVSRLLALEEGGVKTAVR